MTYRQELIKSMKFLAKNPKTIFLGQSISYPGNSMYHTLVGISERKKIELPVMEEVQMGMAIGLALEGYLPVTCYPRFDFLLLAMNQLVNHLDKIRTMSRNQIKLKVIIRTSVAAKEPLDGGPQHTQDYTEAFKLMLTEVNVVLLNSKKQIFPSFKKALERKDAKSTLLIEHGDYYNKK